MIQPGLVSLFLGLSLALLASGTVLVIVSQDIESPATRGFAWRLIALGTLAGAWTLALLPFVKF